MRIKLIFSSSDYIFNERLNKDVNGLVNKLLGNGNKYHGSFSRYSVSDFQGAVWGENGFSFPNGGFFFISSDDADFMTSIIGGIMKSGADLYIKNMKYKGMDVCDFEVGKVFDVVRAISPILITDGKKLVTFRDKEFVGLLTEKSRKKLLRCGLDEKKANSLTLELFHVENANTISVKIGEAINIGSRVMMIVKGDKDARKLIYEIGFGKCTGFGFGAVSVNNI